MLRSRPWNDYILCISCTCSGYLGIKRSHLVSSLSILPLDSVQQSAARCTFVEAFRAGALQVNLFVRSRFRELSWLTDFVTYIGCAQRYVGIKCWVYPVPSVVDILCEIIYGDKRLSSMVEIICWYQLLRLSAQIRCWGQLSIISWDQLFEIFCWHQVLRLSVDIMW